MKKYKMVACALAVSVCGWLVVNADENKYDFAPGGDSQGISFNEGSSTHDGVDQRLSPTRRWFEKRRWKLGVSRPDEGVNMRIREVKCQAGLNKLFWIAEKKEFVKVFIPEETRSKKVSKDKFNIVIENGKYLAVPKHHRNDENFYWKTMVIETNKTHTEYKEGREVKKGNDLWAANIEKMNRYNVAPKAGPLKLKRVFKEVVLKLHDESYDVVKEKMATNYLGDPCWIKEKGKKLKMINIWRYDEKGKPLPNHWGDVTYNSIEDVKESIDKIYDGKKCEDTDKISRVISANYLLMEEKYKGEIKGFVIRETEGFQKYVQE